MLQIRLCGLVAALSLIAVATVQADTRSLLKKNNFFEAAADPGMPPTIPATPPTSPWFNFLVGGTTATGPSADINANDHNQGHSVTFKPDVAGVVAGTVSSVNIVGSFSIKGWSTTDSNFTDFNGIPTGVTVTFKTAMTFSVDTGNYLTLSANGSGSNGLGITPTQGTSGSIDVGETLHVSEMQITSVSFTGQPTGYAFSNPTITNIATYVLRSGNNTDFDEGSENAGLYSLPAGATPTIGFGNGALGTGTTQSNVVINNGFEANGSNFTPISGAYDFKVLAGSMQLRGIGFQYNLGYDIAAIPFLPGDYNKNGVVDAADYALWRKGDLAADSNGDTVIDQMDYEFWRANFGNPNPGAGTGLSSTSVPEPSTLMLVVVGILSTCSGRRLSRTRL